MTSSFRNSLHRREHRERSQPVHRARLGLLEKHKDYVLRARDYRSKRDRVTRLRQIAANRNPDEFYFAMARERTREGVHIKERGNVALPVEVVKVLKSQDENYVRTMRSAGLKKIDKIKNQLMTLIDLIEPSTSGCDGVLQLDKKEVDVLRNAGVLAGPSKRGGQNPKHVVFVDNDEQATQYASKLKWPPSSDVESSDVEQGVVDLGWVSHKQKAKKRHEKPLHDGPQDSSEVVTTKDRKRLIQELSARLVRNKQLQYTAREFEMQRLLMGRGARRKLRGVEKVEESADNEEQDEEDELDARRGKPKTTRASEKLYRPRVYKWRQERKR